MALDENLMELSVGAGSKARGCLCKVSMQSFMAIYPVVVEIFRSGPVVHRRLRSQNKYSGETGFILYVLSSYTESCSQL